MAFSTEILCLALRFCLAVLSFPEYPHPTTDMPLPLLVSLIFVLGFANGLRTLTPVAVLCWGAHLHWFSLAHTPFSFLAHPISLIVFTVLAVGELIGDKLPKTPARIAAFPLLGRLVFGAGSGAALAAIGGAALVLGGVMGAVGAVVGAYTGYFVRRALTTRAGLPDLPVALLEDVVAVGASLFVVSRF
jgi:uncharacterized membrane protein